MLQFGFDVLVVFRLFAFIKLRFDVKNRYQLKLEYIIVLV